MSMCVVVCMRGLTIVFPSMGLPDFWDPSVYMKALGFHAAIKRRTGYRLLLEVCGGVFGHGYAYEWMLPICCESLFWRLRKIVGGCCSGEVGMASRRVWMILCRFTVANAFSLATR